jgi:flagellar hook-basal body complex protein FliE
MVINELNPSDRYLPLIQQQKGTQESKPEDASFASTVNELITDVNALQKDSAEKRDKFIKGEPVDLHDVMISSQMASTSFKLLMELRNKGLDLYNTVMRMQV